VAAAFLELPSPKIIWYFVVHVFEKNIFFGLSQAILLGDKMKLLAGLSHLMASIYKYHAAPIDEHLKTLCAKMLLCIWGMSFEPLLDFLGNGNTNVELHWHQTERNENTLGKQQVYGYSAFCLSLYSQKSGIYHYEQIYIDGFWTANANV
jgi:hypothetical protein